MITRLNKLQDARFLGLFLFPESSGAYDLDSWGGCWLFMERSDRLLAVGSEATGCWLLGAKRQAVGCWERSDWFQRKKTMECGRKTSQEGRSKEELPRVGFKDQISQEMAFLDKFQRPLLRINSKKFQRN